MRRHYYLPTADDKLRPWLNSFSSKLKNMYASRYGISSAEADKIVDFAKFFEFLVNYLEGVRTFSQSLTSYKEGFKKAALASELEAVPQLSYAMPATIPSTRGMLMAIRKLVTRIKAHANYSIADGNDLGIEGASHSFVADNYTPYGKAKLIARAIHISFFKKGVDAMNVYADDADTGKKTLLATHTYSPFVDERPPAVAGKAENRRYVLRGVIADKEIGKWSDRIEVAFGG